MIRRDSHNNAAARAELQERLRDAAALLEGDEVKGLACISHTPAVWSSWGGRRRAVLGGHSCAGDRVRAVCDKGSRDTSPVAWGFAEYESIGARVGARRSGTDSSAPDAVQAEEKARWR
jgi:hypothetical protein